MDTSFYPLLYAMPKKITATVPEWKTLLKLLPPCEEVLPLFKKSRIVRGSSLLIGF